MTYLENMRTLGQYVEALEEERCKIQVFQRELPLCLHLVTQAIESCKQQMATEALFPGRSDCEATSSEGPVLEEFIPVKPSSSSEGEKGREKDNGGAGTKADWLRSVQLWSQENEPPEKEEQARRLIEPNKSSGGAFQPFQREEKPPASTATATAASSSGDTGERNEKEGALSLRKARRCWSPELHRRFLLALEELGGSHVATPKQVRELMKVDGLTNDEVKSHLQKYRLHNRRPSTPTSDQGNNSNNSQPSQFIVVGGIWVPSQEYHPPGMSAQLTSDPLKQLYPPIDAFPQDQSTQSHQQQKKQLTQTFTSVPLRFGVRGTSNKEVDSVGNGNTNSISSTTSTSSHSATTSPASY